MDLWTKLNKTIVSCTRCPRLVAYRQQVAQQKKRQFCNFDYWGKPITGFGDHNAQIVIVGLAPAAHGGNRTGRIFTGDSSAQTLAQALYAVGLASQPFSVHREDGLQLFSAYLSAVCRCAPPQNCPTSEELRNCLPYLAQELLLLKDAKVIVALGQIAFEGTLKALKLIAQQKSIEWRLPSPKPKFRHGACYQLPDPRGGSLHLLASYHPSRQNTQTGRLTLHMLAEVFLQAKALAKEHPHSCP